MLKPPLLVSVGAMVVTMAAQAIVPADAIVIKGDWLVDIRTVVAVGGVVLLGTWRIARWMKKIEDALTVQDEQRARIEKSLKVLPCFNCPPHRRHG